MKWAAVIEYLPDTAKVESVRPAHRAYLTSLLESGRLVLAGPFADGSGALIVYEAETREAVDDLMKNDPFHTAGIFVSWTVRPWKCVLGNPLLLPPNG